MKEETVVTAFSSKERLLKAIPPVWPESLMSQIRDRIQQRRTKAVVLDDDPTGTQTVYDVPVVTEWCVERLRREIREPGPGFYVLTNSRSLTPAETQELHRELGRNLIEAVNSGEESADSPRLCVISRSDSTLRGHFPVEINILGEVLGTPDVVFIVPFFAEGGRLTIDNIHYLVQGEELAPVAATPFAKDPVFGYTSWNLREWIVEKSRGDVGGEQIHCISLDDIRVGGPNKILDIIRGLPKGAFCIVNAAHYRDLEVFTLAVLDAEAEGKRLLFRSAASFVAVRLGLEPRPTLKPTELCDAGSSIGGLVVCGSYVPGSTRQLENLLSQGGIEPVEFDVVQFFAAQSPEKYVTDITQEVKKRLVSGRHVVLFTSRQYVGSSDTQQSLAMGRRIAAALAEIVRELGIRPRFLIAKGGITSSEVATKGLGVRRAMVRGQALPGVPVWELDEHSLYPGLRYIVFPGNVGGPDALARLVKSLSEIGGA